MIRLNQITKLYGDVRAIDGVSLEISDTERIAVLGPSGSGKTTLLRLIAGLDMPDNGEIHIDGSLASNHSWVLEPHLRRLGFVFQTPALWPHMNVAQNILFGLSGMHRVDAVNRVQEMLELMAMQGMEKRYPHELSGGEARRVSLARTLAPKPKYLLMDEPVVNVDSELRTKLLTIIRYIVIESAISLLYVTHEPEEAAQVADRILLIKRGQLQQA